MNNIQDLTQALEKGIVNFKFIKVSGEERIATGTRNLDFIPITNHPKGGKVSDKVLPFFDIEVQGWRSLSVNANFEIC